MLITEQPRPILSIATLETLGLSRREAEVLFWAIDGKSNHEITALMQVTKSTVRKHLENIYLKLQVNSRAAAVSLALKQLGLLCLNSNDF